MKILKGGDGWGVGVGGYADCGFYVMMTDSALSLR